MRSWLIVLLILVPTLVRSKDKLEDPYQSYQDGSYDQALQGFVDTQVEHPDNPRLFINLGSAHYQMKNYQEAEKAFNQATLHGDQRVRKQAYYNLGNNSYRLGKLDEAIEWYKRALEIDPSDEDAKFNLEFVRDEIRRRHQEAQKRQQEQQKQQQNQQRQPDQQQQQNQSQADDQQKQGDQPQQQPEHKEEKPPGDQNRPQPAPSEQKKQEEQEAQGQATKLVKMTPEEAQRYLQGLTEDRKKHLEKRRAKIGQRGRPAKDW